MKGVVFNLLEEAVTRAFGEDAWDDLLDHAGLEGAYTSLGNYPDAELMKLVAAASAKLGKSPDEVLLWFGENAMPLLFAKYPVFFVHHASSRSFLMTVNDVIHKEVKKVYPGADAPSFGLEPRGEDELVLTYASSRRLCALAEGFIRGAAVHFGEEAALRQSECMSRGDDRCVIHACFRKLAVLRP
jgi:hypothetical protein